MKEATTLFSVTLLGVLWLAGIVLAKGFWSTVAAICVLPYAWYLVVERVMAIAGWLSAG